MTDRGHSFDGLKTVTAEGNIFVTADQRPSLGQPSTASTPANIHKNLKILTYISLKFSCSVSFAHQDLCSARKHLKRPPEGMQLNKALRCYSTD